MRGFYNRGMGRIHILSDQVANQIAAGEVVERPASVVKELLENALDAGATRIRVEVEAGGRKLIRMTDNGHGMGRDDALLAFERHATSKLRSAEDLLSIATLGFRGEALPSIASVARVRLETRAAGEEGAAAEAVGTLLEIAGGNILRVEDAGAPVGTSLTIRDLFFNVPARRKFLKSEQTELAHIAALVTHYALAHPTRHFELHTATQVLLMAPAVATSADRLYQIFGRETHGLMLPLAAEMDFRRAGLPEPPPWKREADWEPADPGFLRVSGFVSKPELQKLNRNSIYVFVNRRLIRDRLVLHALIEAYRNVLPPTSFPVVLLFLEMPPEEVDVNVHPAKTEVRFRQGQFVHDFLRDTVRAALIQARPAASFRAALAGGRGDAASSLNLDLAGDVSPLPGEPSATVPARGGTGSGVPEYPVAVVTELYLPGAPPLAGGEEGVQEPWRGPAGFGGESDGELRVEDGAAYEPRTAGAPEVPFTLRAAEEVPRAARLAFGGAEPLAVGYPEAGSVAVVGAGGAPHVADTLSALSTLRPVGQLRDSFILATNEEGLWIIDQHVAHERVLFEKVLRERQTERVQRQRLLLPLLVDLLPEQMVRFAELAEDLERNGFEAEPFGPRTLAIKAAPAGLEGRELELTVGELLSALGTDEPVENAEVRARRIAASIACHAAIKINTPLEAEKMVWLLEALGRTQYPTSCPHGRPIALRYSHRDIARAFQRT